MHDTVNVISKLWSGIVVATYDQMVEMHTALREYNWPIWIIPLALCDCIKHAKDKVWYMPLFDSTRRATTSISETYLHIVHTNPLYPGSVSYQQMLKLVGDMPVPMSSQHLFRNTGVIIPAVSNDTEIVLAPVCLVHRDTNTSWKIDFTLIDVHTRKT